MEVLRGRIAEREGLQEALEIITGFRSVNSGVLDISAEDISGKIGIAWGRFITGACLNSGETGRPALRRLLRLKQGKFVYLDTEGEPVVELRQSLGVDLNGVVPYVPDEIRKTVTSWLYEMDEVDEAPAPPQKAEAPSAELLEMVQQAAPDTAARDASPHSGSAGENEEADSGTAGEKEEAQPPPEQFKLTSALVRQARKEAAAFLNKEARSATHLRLTPVRDGSDPGIQPEEAILVPEIFDGMPSIDMESLRRVCESGSPAGDVIATLFEPDPPAPQAIPEQDIDEVTLRDPVHLQDSGQDVTLADIPAQLPDQGQDVTLPNIPAQPPERAQDITLPDTPVQLLDQAQDVTLPNTAVQLPDRGQDATLSNVPIQHSEPLGSASPQAPIFLDDVTSELPIQAQLVTLPPLPAAVQPPAAPTNEPVYERGNLTDDQKELLDQLVAHARKPTGDQAAKHVDASPIETADLALPPRRPLITQEDTANRLPANRMARSMRSQSNSDTLGIAVFCVLFFVVSCAGTIIFVPRLLGTINTVLHSTH